MTTSGILESKQSISDEIMYRPIFSGSRPVLEGIAKMLNVPYKQWTRADHGVIETKRIQCQA